MVSVYHSEKVGVNMNLDKSMCSVGKGHTFKKTNTGMIVCNWIGRYATFGEENYAALKQAKWRNYREVFKGKCREAKSRKYQGVFKVKSRVKTWQVWGIWSQQLEHKQVPKRGTEPGVCKGKRSLPACNTRCKCSMETTQNWVKVKLGIKVMKLVESLIGWEVTVGLGSECHLTFVRRRLHIAE